MTRKKSFKKNKTRSKKYRAPCKSTKYLCKRGGMWGNRRKSYTSWKGQMDEDNEEHVEGNKTTQESELRDLTEKNEEWHKEKAKEKEAEEKKKKANQKRQDDEENERNKQYHKTSVKSTGNKLHSSLAYKPKGKKSKGGKSKKSKKCKGGKRKKTKRNRRSSKRGG